MGYEVHITRADDWASNEDCAIESSEWLGVVEGDKSLRLTGDNGPHFAVWDGDPNEPEAWLPSVQPRPPCFEFSDKTQHSTCKLPA